MRLYGVIKMNVDTDCQYAFSRPVIDHMMKTMTVSLKLMAKLAIKRFTIHVAT